MPQVVCRLCGKVLPPGTLKYIVQIHVTADFDGYITEAEYNEEVPLERIVEELKKKPAADAEADVQNNLAFFLCHSCKEAFVKHPIGKGKPDSSEDYLH